MQRQLEQTLSVVRAEGLKQARLLDVGCGSAWLSHALSPFGEVWGTDLSAAAIAEGVRRYPALHLRCADFFEIELPGPFDFVVSADALVHMADHRACIARVAQLLRAGGVFLLMTQNPLVWSRRSGIRHVPASLHHWSPVSWPDLPRLREMMRPWFAIERVETLDPGGDQGRLFWVENRYVRGAMGRLIGRQRWRSLLENLHLGRELVIVARRRA